MTLEQFIHGDAFLSLTYKQRAAVVRLIEKGNRNQAIRDSYSVADDATAARLALQVFNTPSVLSVLKLWFPKKQLEVLLKRRKYTRAA